MYYHTEGNHKKAKEAKRERENEGLTEEDVKSKNSKKKRIVFKFFLKGYIKMGYAEIKMM